MIVYDLATKVLDTEIFPQQNITGLISAIAFTYCFVQLGEAFTMTNPPQKHTYTYAIIELKNRPFWHTTKLSLK